jgi:enoyl-CoA hydratase
MSEELNTERIDDVLVVRFTRPEIRNPLSVSVLRQLYEIVDGCAANIRITGLIFTGIADIFASGADLREIAAVTAAEAPDFARYGQSLMAGIAALPQKTIAAVNGYCFGGALDLALACDIRVSSPNARFAHPGAALGIITGWGGTQRLPRLIGQARALEMLYTAEAIDAGRALTYGLIDRIALDVVLDALAECTATAI